MISQKIRKWKEVRSGIRTGMNVELKGNCA